MAETAEQKRRREEQEAQDRIRERNSRYGQSAGAHWDYVRGKTLSPSEMPPPVQSDPTQPTPEAPDASTIPNPNWRVPSRTVPTVLGQLESDPEFQKRLAELGNRPQVVPNFNQPLTLDQLRAAEAQRNAYIDRYGNVFPINRQTGDTANIPSHTLSKTGPKYIDYNLTQQEAQRNAFDPAAKNEMGFWPEFKRGFADFAMQPLYGLGNLLNDDPNKVYGSENEYFRGREEEGLGRPVGNITAGTALTGGLGYTANAARVPVYLSAPLISGGFTASQELNPYAKGEQSTGEFWTKVGANTAAGLATAGLSKRFNPQFENATSWRQALPVLARSAAANAAIGGVLPEGATIIAEWANGKDVDISNIPLRLTGTALMNASLGTMMDFYTARKAIKNGIAMNEANATALKQNYVDEHNRPPSPGEPVYRGEWKPSNPNDPASPVDAVVAPNSDEGTSVAARIFGTPQALQDITNSSGSSNLAKNPVMSAIFTNPQVFDPKGSLRAGAFDPGYNPANAATLYSQLTGIDPHKVTVSHETMLQTIKDVLIDGKPMPRTELALTTDLIDKSKDGESRIAAIHDKYLTQLKPGEKLKLNGLRAELEKAERRTVFNTLFGEGDAGRLEQSFNRMLDYYEAIGQPVKFKPDADVSSPLFQRQFLDEQYDRMMSEQWYDIISGDQTATTKYVDANKAVRARQNKVTQDQARADAEAQAEVQAVKQEVKQSAKEGGTSPATSDAVKKKTEPVPGESVSGQAVGQPAPVGVNVEAGVEANPTIAQQLPNNYPTTVDTAAPTETVPAVVPPTSTSNVQAPVEITPAPIAAPIVPFQPSTNTLPRYAALGNTIQERFGDVQIAPSERGGIVVDVPLARLQSKPLTKLDRETLSYAREENGQTIIEPPIAKSVQQPASAPADAPVEQIAPEPTVQSAPDALSDAQKRAVDAAKAVTDTKTAQQRLDVATSRSVLPNLLRGEAVNVQRLTDTNAKVLLSLGFDFEAGHPITTEGVGTVSGTGRDRTVVLDPDYIQQMKPATDAPPDDVATEEVFDLGKQATVEGEDRTTSNDAGIVVESRGKRSEAKPEPGTLEATNADIADKARKAGFKVEELGDAIYRIEGDPAAIDAAVDPKLTEPERKTYKRGGRNDNSITIYNIAAAPLVAGTGDVAIDELDTDGDGLVLGVPTTVWKAIITAGALGATGMVVGRNGWVRPSSSTAEVAGKSKLYVEPRMRNIAEARVGKADAPKELRRMQAKLKEWDDGIASNWFTKLTRSVEPLSQLAERNPKIKELATANNDAFYDSGIYARRVTQLKDEAVKGLNGDKRNKLAKAIIAADVEATKILNSDMSPYDKGQALDRIGTDEYIAKKFLGGDAKLLPNFRTMRQAFDTSTELQYYADAAKRGEFRIEDIPDILATKSDFDLIEAQYKAYKRGRPRIRKHHSDAEKRKIKKEQQEYDEKYALLISTHNMMKARIQAAENAEANIELSRRRMHINRWDDVKDNRSGGWALQYKPDPNAPVDGIGFDEDTPVRLYFKNEKARQKYLTTQSEEKQGRFRFIDPKNYKGQPPLREKLRETLHTAFAEGNPDLFKNTLRDAIDDMKNLPDSQIDVGLLNQLSDMDISQTPIDRILNHLNSIGKSWSPLYTKRADFDGWQPDAGKEWDFLDYNLGRATQKATGVTQRAYLNQEINKQMSDIATDALYGKYYQWLQRYRQQVFDANNYRRPGKAMQAANTASRVISGSALAMNFSSMTRNILGGLTSTAAAYVDGSSAGFAGLRKLTTEIMDKDSEVRMIVGKLEDAGVFDHTSIELLSQLPGVSKDISDNLLILSHVSERELRRFAGAVAAADYLAANPLPKGATSEMQVARTKAARRHAQQFINTSLGDFSSQAARSEAERLITRAGGKSLLALLSPWFNEMGLFQRLMGKVVFADAQQRRKLAPIMAYISIGLLTGGASSLPWISDGISLMEGMSDKYDEWFGGKSDNAAANTAESVRLGLRSWLKEKGWSDSAVDNLINSVENGVPSVLTNTNLGRNASIKDAFDPIVYTFWKDLSDRMDKAGPDNWAGQVVEQFSRTVPAGGRIISAVRQLKAGKQLNSRTGTPDFTTEAGKVKYVPYKAQDALKEALFGRKLERTKAAEAEHSDRIPLASPVQKAEYAETVVGTQGTKINKGQKGDARKLITKDAHKARKTVLDAYRNDPTLQQGIDRSSQMLKDKLADPKLIEDLRKAAGTSVDFDAWMKQAPKYIKQYYEAKAVSNGLTQFFKKEGKQIPVKSTWERSVSSHKPEERGYWYAIGKLKGRIKDEK